MTWQSAFELSVGEVQMQLFLRHERYQNVLLDKCVALQFSVCFPVPETSQFL